MHLHHRFFLFALAAAWLLRPALARANGRFPAANQLVTDPSDPKHIVVRTTYGLLQSTDGGGTWGWICEAAIGQPVNSQEDPPVGITMDGTTLAGLSEGLTQSHDRGCNWSFAAGPLDQEVITDLAVDRARPSRAIAVTSTAEHGAFHVILAETLDNGATWNQAGAPITGDFFALTSEVAPSDPDRIYVSGLVTSTQESCIEWTKDRGMTWTQQLIGSRKGVARAWIGAVDPNDPLRIYLRIANDPSSMTANDDLLVSSDGGVSWTKIYTSMGPMLGFALSPDGNTLAVGGPLDGIHVSSAHPPGDAYAFPKASDVMSTCLTWTDAGLYACGVEKSDGFTVGLSNDQGKTFTPLNHLSEFCPLTCATGTPAGDVCPEAWTTTQASIMGKFACPGLEANPEAGQPSDSSADSALDRYGDLIEASIDDLRDSGAPTKVEPGGEASTTSEPAAPAPAASGCGCRVAAGNTTNGEDATPPLPFLLAGALVFRWTKRERSARRRQAARRSPAARRRGATTK